MAIYLVQHGLSLNKDEDPERGLSAAGITTTRQMAEVAAGYQVQVTTIQHSPKKRARQTAELLAAALQPSSGSHETTGLLPLDDVGQVAGGLHPHDNLMLVGHLPFMARLTGQLITGNPDQLIFKFQNSGIVCLDQDADNPAWFIKWTLMPTIG